MRGLAEVMGRWLGKWIAIGDSYAGSDPNVRVGAHTYGISRKTFYLPTGRERVEIGKYCSIAEGVEFVFGDHPLHRVSTYPLRFLLRRERVNADALYKGPIRVGNDVWIGRNSLILANVEIGDGAVIAAGSVVTRNVEPYAVVAGVPARFVKYRFSAAEISELLAIRWWDWPEAEILQNLELFYGEVADFIEAAHNRS
jgi:chloramphenicol O-acetyltransferase type B